MINLLILTVYLSIGLLAGIKAFNDSTPDEQRCKYHLIGITIGVFLWPMAAIGVMIWYLIVNIRKA
jgi:hypothetical protein